jgi:hypothetical protein
MRLRSSVIGALNLFRTSTGPMPGEDLLLARAFADVATIAILQDQTVRDAETRTRQLQHALDSRVVIEQAKGMVAEHAKLDMDQAFGRLRSYARSHNRRLGVLAAELVNGTVELSALGESTDPAGQPGGA